MYDYNKEVRKIFSVGRHIAIVIAFIIGLANPFGKHSNDSKDKNAEEVKELAMKNNKPQVYVKKENGEYTYHIFVPTGDRIIVTCRGAYIHIKHAPKGTVVKVTGYHNGNNEVIYKERTIKSDKTSITLNETGVYEIEVCGTIVTHTVYECDVASLK